MRRVSVIIFLVIILEVFVYFSQAPNKQIPNEDFSNLTFRVDSTKSQYIWAEPIPLILSLENKTGKAIKGEVALVFSSGNIRMFVERPDKSVSQIKPLSLIRGCLGCESTELIPPYARYQRKEILENSLEDFFSTSGEYKIWAELCDKICSESNIRSVLSNSITINIKTPQGTDYEAYKVLKSLPSDPLDKFEKKSIKKYMQVLEEFVSNYNGTPYGDYVVFELANIYTFRKEYEKALNQLEKISRDFIFIEIGRAHV